MPFDPPKKTAVTHVLIDKPSNMEDLYYLYIYDKPYKTFRVIDYTNFCPNAVRNGKFPITSEVLIDNIETDLDLITERSIKELKDLGIIDKSHTISFSTSEILPNGFPTPTLNNVKVFDYFRSEIKKLELENCISIGLQAEKNLFFQNQVLIDMYEKLCK